MIKAMIIEDELHSRELLEQMLGKFFPNIQIIGTAGNVKSGIQMIQQLQPDLILLDIYISGGNGFDILDAVDLSNTRIIFVTGYEEYALKAIKYAALDYLLKPVILDELKQAIDKLEVSPNPDQQHLDFLENQLTLPVDSFEQIILSDYKKHNIVNLSDILFVEAKRSYTIFHLKEEQTRIASNPLSFYENLLPENKFYRIHKSYLINCEKVTGFETGRGGQVKLNNGQLLPIAFRRKSAFLRFINQAKAM